MSRSAFNPGFEDLPRVIPVFPLTGVLLLPGGHLPLNIFEPRYLAMVRDALADPRRVVGMVQPRVPTPDDNRGPIGASIDPDRPTLYGTGCAGRIVGFNESEDGRYQIGLSGVCRFDIAEEMAPRDGYRRVLADYRRYRNDLSGDRDATVDRDRLLTTIRRYFEQQSIKASWDAVEATPSDRLVTSLAMTCPFGPTERQALLEAPGLTERAEMIVTLLEMALLEAGGSSGASH